MGGRGRWVVWWFVFVGYDAFSVGGFHFFKVIDVEVVCVVEILCRTLSDIDTNQHRPKPFLCGWILANRRTVLSWARVDLGI